MSRFLILFASHHGQTRKIATRIAEHLRTRHHHVDLIDLTTAREAQRPRVADYDGVVLGSRIEYGRHASVMTAYVIAHRDELARVSTAFFSVSMAASGMFPGADPNHYLEAFFTATAWRPTRAVAFAGGLPYRDYNLVKRFVMKLVSRAAGHPIDTTRNHELTNWAQVHELADSMIASSSSATA